MTTPTIRAALERLVEALDEYDPKWDAFPDDALAAGKAALDAAQPEGEGLEPTHEQISQWINANPVLRPGSLGGPMIRVGTDWRAAFADAARWGAQFRPAAPPAPPEGEVAGLTDNQLLSIASDCRALYVADDVDDDNYSEVLAAMRAAIAADRATPPAPLEGEVGELVVDMRGTASGLESHSYPQTAALIYRAATLLEHLSAAAPAVVAVAERLPGPGDCDAEGFCWFWSPEDRCWFWERIESDFCRRYGAEFEWLPAHALPLPAPQGGEVDG